MLLPSRRREIPAHCEASLWSSCLACTLTFYKISIDQAESLRLADFHLYGFF